MRIEFPDLKDLWSRINVQKLDVQKVKDFAFSIGEQVQDFNILETAHDKLKALKAALTWKHWAILAAFLFIFLLSGLYLIFGGREKAANIPDDAKIYITVKPGMSASEVGDMLLARGVIDSKLRFWWMARVKGYAKDFRAGTYLMSSGMDEEAALKKIVSGEVVLIKFTIPEGFTVRDIANRLAEEGIVDKKEFLKKAKKFTPFPYMKKGGDIRYAAEGYLFPDTYEIHENPTVDNILEVMSSDFDQRLTEEMRARAKEMNLSIHDLVTLASLVEKEARYDADRPIIAQVFLKRLKIGMPLQTDASLQYLMDAPKEDVSISDTKIDSPYNTYQNAGLPPGPIANPGMAAIEAVLHPADTDYLYFVADRDGHNHYASTYDEHMALVNEYR